MPSAWVNTMISERTPRKNERHALVIMTDGEENSSTEFSKPNIASILKNRQEIDNWLVMFLGANMDAIAEGASFGTRACNTMSFDTANVGIVASSAARATRAYGASGQSLDAAFTLEERMDAVGDPSALDEDIKKQAGEKTPKTDAPAEA